MSCESTGDTVRRRVTAIGVSFFVSLVLMAIKFYAYRVTGSSAVLSDALESTINVVASAFGLYSVVLASRPPDESHPYGHGKIEYFSAGFEGALIILAAFGIFRTAWSHILNPHEIPELDYGLLLLVTATAVNLILGMGLIRVGKSTRSLVLEADGKHILTDVATSLGVLAGLLLVRWTGWYRLDGIMAFLVGINIIFMGAGLVRQSLAGLMNETDPALLEEICKILIEHRKDIWIDVHRLRAWRSGSRVHIDFHLILPRDCTLEEAHDEVKELEAILGGYFHGEADVLIHADPCIESECTACNFDPCNLRGETPQHQGLWRREEVTSEARIAERTPGNDINHEE